ncbi:hypothetical protein CHS0354_011322 [Potamilus streckersoni]|uniref:Uncharacterized protein n=1 Tax=Potamilus streckersoni TaxID=2493646 RepID=A0AAE0TES2_9BIVA|nr:hypothetical protein CHS0354_011322 [Potamilus streckersoni]
MDQVERLDIIAISDPNPEINKKIEQYPLQKGKEEVQTVKQNFETENSEGNKEDICLATSQIRRGKDSTSSILTAA